MEEIVHSFFDYLKRERFEEGYDFMQDLLHKGKTDAQQKALLTYGKNFLKAKDIVETSYRYAEATQLYNDAASAIAHLDPKFSFLRDFALLQAAILQIDRGIYTGNARLMQKAANDLYTNASDIKRKLHFIGTDEKLSSIIALNLEEKANEDIIYAEAIRLIAKLYLHRWEEYESFHKDLNRIETSLEKLENTGNKRLASDLAPHLHILKRFQQRRGNDGKLFVEDGEISFYYYASLDPSLRQPYNELLKQALDERNTQIEEILEEVLQTVRIVSEEMGDIWFGLESISYIDTYAFGFQNITIKNFRQEGDKTANVTLRYYTMGVFELKITFEADLLQQTQISLTAMRHLLSLATPFALDEKIHHPERTFSYIYEYAAYVFELVNERTKQFFEKTSTQMKFKENESILTHNTIHNRFSLVRINRIVERNGERIKKLHPQDFHKHFQYKALAMPVREVRSTIDNWIMYDDSTLPHNIAPLRYNESEYFGIEPYHCVIALLEQPIWVFDQAVESAEVASAILHLLALSNIKTKQEIDNLQKIDTYTEPDKKRLKKQKQLIEQSIEELDRFKEHITKLLETVEAGKMMTYPDHTAFIRELFEEIGLKTHKQKTLFLQKILKEKRSKKLENIKTIDAMIAYSQQKIIRIVVSIASVFITLGSLKDIFDLWGNSKTIQKIGWADFDGDIRLGIVLTLVGISTLWLIYDNYFLEKKGK